MVNRFRLPKCGRFIPQSKASRYRRSANTYPAEPYGCFFLFDHFLTLWPFALPHGSMLAFGVRSLSAKAHQLWYSPPCEGAQEQRPTMPYPALAILFAASWPTSGTDSSPDWQASRRPIRHFAHTRDGGEAEFLPYLQHTPPATPLCAGPLQRSLPLPRIPMGGHPTAMVATRQGSRNIWRGAQHDIQESTWTGDGSPCFSELNWAFRLLPGRMRMGAERD